MANVVLQHSTIANQEAVIFERISVSVCAFKETIETSKDNIPNKTHGSSQSIDQHHSQVLHKSYHRGSK